MTFVELYQDYREAGTAGLLRLRTDGAPSSAAAVTSVSAGAGTVNLFDRAGSWSRVAATINDGRRAVGTRLGGVVAMSAAAAACLGGIFAVGGVATNLAATHIRLPQPPGHGSGKTHHGAGTPGANPGSTPPPLVSNGGSPTALLTAAVVKTPRADSNPLTVTTSGSGGSSSSVGSQIPPPGPTGPISTPTGVGAVVNDLTTTVAVTVSGLTNTVGTTVNGLVNTLGGTLSGGVGAVGALLHLV